MIIFFFSALIKVKKTEAMIVLVFNSEFESIVVIVESIKNIFYVILTSSHELLVGCHLSIDNKLKFNEFKICTSKSCITKSAIIGDKGEPIGVPNVCL